MKCSRRWPAWGVIVVLALALPGCGGKQVGPGDDYQRDPGRTPERVTETEPAPVREEPTTRAPERDDRIADDDDAPIRPTYTNAQKHDIVHKALLNLQRMMISSRERIALPDGVETTTVARDVLANKMAELSFNVIEMTDRLPFEPSEAQQDRFRAENDCNLAFLMDGEAEQFDKHGNYYLYKCKLRGKVLNLTTHQQIATKTVRRKGPRDLDEAEAGEDALEKAAEDLAAYLTDEVTRKWEATSLVRMRLAVSGLRHFREADDLRVGLQQRVGIYYVSLERWDDRSDTAEYDVLCRFDVERFLAPYVDELRRDRVRIESVERHGKVIKADQDFFD